MISERRILANQINGKKSRGPQTWAGKMRARQNALRHGLSTIGISNPIYANEIAEIVKAICGDRNDPLLIEQAVVIAESVVVLRYVRIEQAAAIDWFRHSATTSGRQHGVAEPKARFNEMEVALAELQRIHFFAKGPSKLPGEMRNPTEKPKKPPAGPDWMPQRERSEEEAMRAAMPELRRLARYERRAWSRRKRALRRFMEIEAQLAGYAAVTANEARKSDT